MLETGLRYAEHLSDADLVILADAAPLPAVPPGEAPRRLRANPQLIEQALASPGTFERLFADPGEILVRASPFVVFAVAVHHTLDELGRARFVEERVGSRMRVPVFEVDHLRELGGDPARRLVLIELLASYTRVASGPVWFRRGGRWRHQRWSELDAARLAAVVDLVPASERAGYYRRLGDLALFLTGVFPDHTSRRAMGPVELERLARSVRDLGPLDVDDARRLGASAGAVLELLGPRWYRLAARHTPLPGTTRTLDDLAARFDLARRFLNLVTDRVLFPLRGHLFGPSGV